MACSVLHLQAALERAMQNSEAYLHWTNVSYVEGKEHKTTQKIFQAAELTRPSLGGRQRVQDEIENMQVVFTAVITDNALWTVQGLEKVLFPSP